MGLTRCRKSSVIFWGLLRNTIKTDLYILAVVLKLYVLQLAYFSARLLEATYISLPSARLSTPNNVRSTNKNQTEKKTRLIRVCTAKHCRRSQKCTPFSSANQPTFTVLALELTSQHTKQDQIYTTYQ